MKVMLVIRKIFFSFRRFYYILRGAKLGKSVGICSNVKIGHPENLEIGENSIINPGCILSAFEKIKIGKGCQIAPYCAIYDNNHVMPLYNRKPHNCNPIEIGDFSWIGTKVVILKGIKIGKNVTVGAGSVVTKSFPDNSIIVGVPAKKIGENKK